MTMGRKKVQSFVWWVQTAVAKLLDGNFFSRPPAWKWSNLLWMHASILFYEHTWNDCFFICPFGSTLSFATSWKTLKAHRGTACCRRQSEFWTSRVQFKQSDECRGRIGCAANDNKFTWQLTSFLIKLCMMCFVCRLQDKTWARLRVNLHLWTQMCRLESKRCYDCLVPLHQRSHSRPKRQ